MKEKIRLSARALIRKEDKLLFVSDEGEYWYLPGGRIEGDETLEKCLEREVYEETGLSVKTGKLLYVLECFDIKSHTHRINFYFGTMILNGDLSVDWRDEGGSVQYWRYFNRREIQEQATILPRFLATTDWYAEKPSDPVYQGCVTMRGFEMVNIGL